MAKYVATSKMKASMTLGCNEITGRLISADENVHCQLSLGITFAKILR